VALEVVEHVEDVDSALANIRRVVADDGVVVVSTPNNGVLWMSVWFFWVKSFGRMWDDTHKVSWGQGQWLGKFAEYFDIVDYKVHWGVNLIVKMRKKAAAA
jgi:2-polyprenyl-3-methyl-5-hydroxy-6-metoxy-1,4-benzoquinol methylase